MRKFNTIAAIALLMFGTLTVIPMIAQADTAIPLDTSNEVVKSSQFIPQP
ncbi:hypothetical protein [Chroogloeocystis siderophila]